MILRLYAIFFSRGPFAQTNTIFLLISIYLGYLSAVFKHSEENLFSSVGDIPSSRYTGKECSTDIFP